MHKKLNLIISISRSAEPARQSLEQELATALADRPDLEVTVVPHLYDLAPDGPGMTCLQGIDGHMIMLASLYPRAAHWVLDANQIKGRMGRSSLMPDDLPDRTIWCLDIRPHNDAEPLLAEIARIAGRKKGTGTFCRDGPKGASRKMDLSRFSSTERMYVHPQVAFFRGFLNCWCLWTYASPTQQFQSTAVDGRKSLPNANLRRPTPGNPPLPKHLSRRIS